MCEDAVFLQECAPGLQAAVDVIMSGFHLLLWSSSPPYNWESLDLFQPMSLSPRFLFNFTGCTAAPVSAVAVMVPP